MKIKITKFSSVLLFHSVPNHPRPIHSDPSRSVPIRSVIFEQKHSFVTHALFFSFSPSLYCFFLSIHSRCRNHPGRRSMCPRQCAASGGAFQTLNQKESNAKRSQPYSIVIHGTALSDAPSLCFLLFLDKGISRKKGLGDVIWQRVLEKKLQEKKE